ncbi:hypothetical protein SGL43_01333 [Streptomyces globisporus]|uniref:Uncharacterized protein n=1 Tax=Streptomyces globisporus TaxID=1908 RepID=A0ABM9GSH3_STRGL|nr:hypothetical protein SGL43_01333 [Streptomyces globisporus]
MTGPAGRARGVRHRETGPEPSADRTGVEGNVTGPQSLAKDLATRNREEKWLVSWM